VSWEASKATGGRPKPRLRSLSAAYRSDDPYGPYAFPGDDNAERRLVFATTSASDKGLRDRVPNFELMEYFGAWAPNLNAICDAGPRPRNEIGMRRMMLLVGAQRRDA
jgi:hypothetical protein